MSSEHTDSTDEAQRLSVHLVNGPTVACGNVKAIEEGLLLFEDPGRERVSGFVPYDELRFVLPADESVGGETDERDGGETAEGRADADVRGAEAAAEAEAQEPDATRGATEDGDEETTSEASARSQATIEGETDAPSGDPTTGARDLTAVQGVGEAYADDLEDAGLGSLDALAAADASDVSEAAGVSPERAEQWIADAAEASGAGVTEEDADGTGAEA